MTIIKKYFWLITFSFHFLVLFILYNRFGFNFSNEADKYLTAAAKIDFSNFTDILRHQWFSSTYIIFLALCLKLGLSLTAILMVQYLISLAGFYYFYKFLISQVFFGEWYSKICMLLIMCCPIILYWQLTLFSESFFIALNMIATYFAFNSSVRKDLILTLIFGALLLFCRPVGAFYVLALMFVVMKLNGIKTAPLIFGALYLLLVILIVFMMPLHYKGIALPVFRGSVICGYPLYPEAVLPEGNYTLMEIYLRLNEQHGIGEFVGLLFRKVISFFTLTRPYYSASHNLVNAAHYVFLLGGLFSVFKLKQIRSNSGFTNYALILIVSSALLTMLFYNEWSERYIVPLFPFFILLFVLFISKTRKTVAV